MQKDLLIWREFGNEIDDLSRHINVEHRKHEVLEIPQFVPADIAIIETVRANVRDNGGCHVRIIPSRSDETVQHADSTSQWQKQTMTSRAVELLRLRNAAHG